MRGSRRALGAWGWAGAWALAAGAGLAGSASGQLVSVSYASPDDDRWNYPFNSTPGTRLVSTTFAALLISGFDDRDAQVIWGYDTAPEVPAGLGVERYHVRRVTVRARIADDQRFEYDPTHDGVRTYYASGDPERLADGDVGRPIELFGVGFRGGLSASTWDEFSVWGGTGSPPPAENARFAFAAVFDVTGSATDVSRNVRQRFEAVPMAVGTTEDAAPGQLVGIDSEFAFEVDLTRAEHRAYFARGLAAGRVLVTAASLHPASGGPGGGTGNFPAFYMKEFDPGLAASLEIEVVVGSRADVNGDGTLDAFDFNAFVDAFNAGDLVVADFNDDGTLDAFDFNAFVDVFNLG